MNRKEIRLLWLYSDEPIIFQMVKIQVKIFEEDFRKERSDRERMNEEKEDLRRQVERLQGQITNLTNQVSLLHYRLHVMCIAWQRPQPYLNNVRILLFYILFCGSASSGTERVSERTNREMQAGEIADAAS